jgi:hypothetical protein
VRAPWVEATPWSIVLPPAPAWMSQAACLGEDPDLFHTEEKYLDRRGRTRRAVEICRGCPVRRACLEECYEPITAGIVRGEDAYTGEREWHDRAADPSSFGIWGGTTPEDRRALKHLPISLRIEVLLEQVERTGAPLRRRYQAAVEIVSTWSKLGRPQEVPARVFGRLVKRHGEAAVFRARRELGIRAEPDRRPGSGRVAGWRWSFPAELSA